ncbi:regulatory LuxR family protein [Rhodococcus sp. OK519]|uniref:AAA family ATPase n=1 Tax=Rhodococcus sp. OK519 TaxID=2135729 RepID=UPI000D3A9C9F|nr:regulatory LuxR family protein [Rhodococcus sp. OK519]
MGSAFGASRISSEIRRDARVVGREQHLADLAACAERARGGDGQVVVVEGDSGFGKTALVHAFLGRESGWFVASALADDSAFAAPYGVVDQILGELEHGSDAVSSAGAVILWGKGIRGIADAVIAAVDAVDRPVCIVVDDAQWVDDDSAGVLMLVAQAVRHRAVLVVLSARRDRTALLNRARRIAEDPARGAVVEVDALRPTDVRALVETALDIDYPLRAATVLADYAQGCPLDLITAIEAVAVHPTAAADQLMRHVPDLVGSVRAVLLQVTASCRRCIELMAVLDAPTPVTELDSVATRLGSPVDVPAALSVDLIELENARGVLTVRPLHVRVRDAVLATMDGDVVRLVHAAIADVATGHRALLHRAASCADRDEEFAAYLEDQAADARAYGDLDRAVGYGVWSTRLSADRLARRRRLVASAATAVAGRHMRVFDELVEGLEALDSDPERDLLLAYSQLRRGDAVAAHGYASVALSADLDGERPAVALRIVVTCELASALAAGGNMGAVATLCNVLDRDLAALGAAHPSRRAGDGIPIDLVGREIELSALRSAVAHYTEGIAVRLSPVAVLLGHVAPDRWDNRHAIALITRGTLLHKDGQLHSAVDDLVSGLSLVDDESSWIAQQGRIELAMVQFRLGAWDDAERTAAEALDIALDLGDPWSTAPSYAVASLVPVGRGQLAVAERRLGLAKTALSQAGTLLAYRTIALVDTLIAVAQHRPDRALSAMRTHRVHADVGDRVGNWDAAEAVALLELGRADEALVALDRRERTETEYLLVRGAVLFVVGERREAAGLLRAALAALTDDTSVIVKGVTWHRVGMFLTVDGEPEAGEVMIRQARDLYVRLGAAQWLEACEADLAAVLRRAASASAVRGGGEHDKRLTAREHEIALLVGDGFTNREVAERLTLSIRTVDFHLRNVLHKLGFVSRRQLRGWLGLQRTPRGPADAGVETRSPNPKRWQFRAHVLRADGVDEPRAEK